MKNLSMILVAAVLAGLIGCASLGTTTPPAGCENSLIYKHKTTVDVSLTAAVWGLHAMQQYQPEYYRMAHLAAQAAAAKLQNRPMSLSELVDGSLITLITPLLSLFPVDQVLSQCDRDYLASYLLMVRAHPPAKPPFWDGSIVIV